MLHEHFREVGFESFVSDGKQSLLLAFIAINGHHANTSLIIQSLVRMA